MDVDGMMILNWVLSEKCVKALTGLFSNCPGLRLLSGFVNVPLDVRGICWLV